MDTILDFLKKLFDASDFMPRWKCGRWNESTGWICILSDINIGISYLAIPLMIFFFVRRRKDIPFAKVFVLFSFFIIFCGLSHLADAIMFWHPLYRFNAIILLITALLSSATVLVLYKVLPEALHFKSPTQLQKIIDEQTQALKVSNKKLRESEQQFKALINNNPDIIMMIGKDLKYKFINESLGLITDRDIEKYIGKTPMEVLPESETNKAFFIESLQGVFATGKGAHYELKTKTDRKGDAYFDISIIPLQDENGEVNNVLTLSKDITLIRNNEQQLISTIDRLEKLSKRLEYKRNVLQDFAYIVSHNLRSPTGNLMSLQDVYRRTTDPEMKEEILAKFFAVADQLSNTVQNLSEVVNINQSLEVHRDELRFETVLQNLITSLSEQITASKAVITYDFSECEQISYPKMYLESVLLNLLTNAIKYASPDRTPEISFVSHRAASGLISLECSDNGLGIDLKKYGGKVFTLNKTFHNNPDARGIGLFITKHQIRSLGGSITIESEPNKGTKFIIKFNEIEVL